MVGILILIPIIILLVVAMVSSIVSTQAHIAVENIELKYKNSDSTIYELSLNLENVADKEVNLNDYFDVVVSPKKANNYTIEWKISDDIFYTDSEYEKKHIQYVNNPASSEKVWPAAAFVDDNGNEVSSNTTGKMVIGSYCTFTVQVVAENVSKTLSVKVVGYDVQRVDLRAQSGEGKLSIGESVRILPFYMPIDSIVNDSEWTSSNTQVAIVDQNGVVTGVGAGKAVISHGAKVFSSGAMVYGTCEVEVSANGASMRYGSKVVTSRSTLTLAELGISDEAVAVSGCTVENGEVTITANKAVLSVNDKTFEIEKCGADEIVINNKDFYAYRDGGYVLAVGEHTLKLSAVWADMTNETVLTNVSWQSDNQSIATVNEKGEVKGISSGLATITATANGKSASVTINVQNKLASVQLRTSQASLAVGLAREMVFASQKFLNPANVKTDDTKIANSTFIVVQGEPENATSEELDLFYSAFNFEVVEGGEYAHFDSAVRNKLVFSDDGKALEGKGKQGIKVRVSAKYPKYEGMSKFTTQEVTINAIYGVAVSSVAEIEVASKYQRAYSEAEGNAIKEAEVDRFTIKDTTYIVINNVDADRTYAICLEADCNYGDDWDGSTRLDTADERVNFYGDVYGNGHMISAALGQLGGDNRLVRISLSNVTMSNITLRANTMSMSEDSDTVSGVDVNVFDDFSGIVMTIGSHVNWNKYRLKNVNIEYSIIENATQGVSTYNADVSYTGCIIRNMSKIGMFIKQSMNESEGYMYPQFSHVNLHNVVCSNTLGSMMSISYERYTIDNDSNYRFAEGNLNKDDSGELLAKNEEYFMEYFYDKGYNCIVNQTGFMRAYNWQKVSNAGLIKTGNTKIDNLIGTLAGAVILENSAFKDYVYSKGEKDDEMVSIAFICVGISMDDWILKEPTYLQLSMAEDEFYAIDTRTIKPEGSTIAESAARVVSNISMKLYGYKTTSTVSPTSTYVINDAFIASLHD